MVRAKATAVLVDGSNLYASVKALGFSVDYKTLLNSFGDELIKAVYFTAMKPSDEQSTIRPMVDYLEYNGWQVIQKPTKEFVDPITGKVNIKGNMDIEIAVTAMEMAPYVTDIVLFSGDGDFKFLLESLQRRAVRVTVVSTIRNDGAPMCADILRRQADAFIDLKDLRPSIERDSSVITPRKAFWSKSHG